jgi:tetratricopeptide (TPR) repeat protein
MSMFRRPWSLGSVLVFSVLLCELEPVARADDTAMKLPAEPTALVHYTQGNRLYRLRKFEDAIGEYQAGAMIDPAPVFDYNLGQCYRQLGKYTEAIWHYERFLKSGQPDSQRQALVTGFLVQMRAELERKAMTQPPTDSASDSRPSAVPPPPAAPQRRRGMPLQRKLALGVGAAGGVGVALGVVLGLRARSLEGDAYKLCPMESCDRPDEANVLIERGQSSARYSNVAFGVGGAAILGAAALWLTGARAERKPVTIVPRRSSDFVGLAALLRF